MKKGIYITLILLIVSLSIGYSAFSENLSLDNISADVRVKTDIRITGISVYSSENEALSSAEDYSVNSVFSDINLPNSSSSITYLIDITNFEKAEMGILNIEGLPNNLTYTLEDYNLKDKICENEKCSLGITKTIKLTVKYKENGFKEDKDYNINLKFDFKPFHKISYIDLNETNFPSEIIDSSALEIDLKGQNISKIMASNQPLILNEDYVIEGGKLKIFNVTNDLTITGKKTVIYDNLLADGDFASGEFTPSNDKDKTLGIWKTVGNTIVADGHVIMSSGNITDIIMQDIELEPNTTYKVTMEFITAGATVDLKVSEYNGKYSSISESYNESGTGEITFTTGSRFNDPVRISVTVLRYQANKENVYINSVVLTKVD